MSAQPSGVSLHAPPFNYYSHIKYDVEAVRKYHELIRRLMDKMNKGEPVYVVFNDERRKGSIGKILSWTVKSRPAHSSSHYYRIPFETFDIYNIEVGWDDRKNVIRPTTYDIQIVEEWTGGTKYVYEKPQPRELTIPKVYDRLGEEIKVGNFISFVYQKYGAVELMYGTVTRINHNGTVWAKNMKLSSDDTSEEHKIRDNSNAVVMEKNFMDKLLMFKLSVF